MPDGKEVRDQLGWLWTTAGGWEVYTGTGSAIGLDSRSALGPASTSPLVSGLNTNTNAGSSNTWRKVLGI